MKKLKNFAKKTTAATTLLLGLLGSGSATANAPWQAVQDDAGCVHQLVKSDAKADDVFVALVKLSHSVEKMTGALKAVKFKLKDSKFNTLLMLRQLLDFNSSLLISKYEQDIFFKYRTQYRAYSNAVAQLDLAIFKIRERKGLVKVAQFADLNLTQAEYDDISEAAKLRSEYYNENHA